MPHPEIHSKEMQVNIMLMITLNNAITICFLPSIGESLIKMLYIYNKLIISCNNICGVLLKGERTKVISNRLTHS